MTKPKTSTKKSSVPAVQQNSGLTKEMSSIFDMIEKGEIEMESLDNDYLNFEEQGLEDQPQVLLFKEKTTIENTINNSGERVPAVILQAKDGKLYVNADKVVVSKLATVPDNTVVIITYLGKVKGKSKFEYRDFSVSKARILNK